MLYILEFLKLETIQVNDDLYQQLYQLLYYDLNNLLFQWLTQVTTITQRIEYYAHISLIWGFNLNQLKQAIHNDDDQQQQQSIAIFLASLNLFTMAC